MPLPSSNALTFRTTDMTKWGIGKGAPLTKGEVDLNFWELLTYIADVAVNAQQPLEISSITVTNGKMTITLSDGITTFGPFDLPQNAFRWTGAFVGGTAYKRMDVLTAASGAYLVLLDHTGATLFDPAATQAGNPLYALMFPYQNIYDISFYFPGSVGNGLGTTDAMFALRFARDAYLPLDLVGSLAGFQVSPTALFEVDIQKNGVTIGSMSYDPGASAPSCVFSFAANVQFHSGDLLSVLRPATIDATARGLSMTLVATKGAF